MNPRVHFDDVEEFVSETTETQTETVEYTIRVTADEDNHSEFEETVAENGGEIVNQRSQPDNPEFELPEYLQKVVDEAEEAYKSDEDENLAALSQEIAWHHEELYPQLQTNRRDYLLVLQDLRELGYLCGDELEYYTNSLCVSDPNSYEYAEATLRAITRRSLEQLIYERLSEDDQVDF